MPYRAFLLIVLLAVLLAASTSSPHVAILVLSNWLRSALPLVPLALAAGLIISCGQIDIASGAAFSFVGMILIAWSRYSGARNPIAIGILIAWSAVIVFYALMYTLVVRARIPALLCTLGLALCGQSISLILQAFINRPIASVSPSGVGGMTVPLMDLGIFTWNTTWILVVVGIFAVWRYASYAGLDHIAVGMDPVAAEISGIKTQAIYLRAFLISGFLVGLSAILFLVNVQLGGWATNMGWGKELFAIAAAVIGGCRITGGRLHPISVALATILVFGITDITNSLNIPLEFNYLFLGAGVIVVALIDAVRIRPRSTYSRKSRLSQFQLGGRR
jgi:ribose/xylose/arabinose/galactoside ABC-type transport system permease subunit